MCFRTYWGSQYNPKFNDQTLLIFIIYGGLATKSLSFTPDNRKKNDKFPCPVSTIIRLLHGGCLPQGRLKTDTPPPPPPPPPCLLLASSTCSFALLHLFPGLLSEPQGLLLLAGLRSPATMSDSESDGLRPVASAK